MRLDAVQGQRAALYDDAVARTVGHLDVIERHRRVAATGDALEDGAIVGGAVDLEGAVGPYFGATLPPGMVVWAEAADEASVRDATAATPAHNFP